jgi:hypothetical protein
MSWYLRYGFAGHPRACGALDPHGRTQCVSAARRFFRKQIRNSREAIAVWSQLLHLVRVALAPQLKATRRAHVTVDGKRATLASRAKSRPLFVYIRDGWLIDHIPQAGDPPGLPTVHEAA